MYSKVLFNIIIIILAKYLFSAKTNKQAVSIGSRPWDWKMTSTVFNERKCFETVTVGRWKDVSGSQPQGL